MDKKEKILLVDVDSKIPNIALGKLSTYHKAKGYDVTYLKLGLRGFQKNARAKVIDGSKYRLVYVSNIFTTNQNKFKVIKHNGLWIGGVGSINPMLRLPDEIDRMEVDYSLWPDNDKSYGFLTRGCIRKCKFCFVPKIEGKISFYRNVSEVVRHKTAIFLDNNILAYKGHLDILRELRDKKITCQFNQGLDIRLLNDKNAKLLSEITYHQKYIFAFDNINYKKHVEKGTKLFQKYVPGKWAMRFLVYYNSEDPLSELVYRINWSKRHFVLPFIMRDKNCVDSLHRDFLTDYSGYVGSTGGQFCAMTFGQYLYSIKKPLERIHSSLSTYLKAKKGKI